MDHSDYGDDDEKVDISYHEKPIPTRLEGLRRRDTNSSDKVRMNWVGKVYRRVTQLPKPVRYMIYILPFAFFLAIPILVLGVTGWCDIYVGQAIGSEGQVIRGPHLLYLFVWIEVTWLAIFAVKILAWALPIVFVFCCGILSSGVRKYATILTNLCGVLQFFLWALTTWLTFRELIVRDEGNPKDVKWVIAMHRLTGALAISATVLLIEKIFVQLIAVSYHQRSFANRIKVSKREIHLLGILYDASRALFPMYCPEFINEDIIIRKSIESQITQKRRKSTTFKRKESESPPTPVRMLSDFSRFRGKLTSAVSKAATLQFSKPTSSHTIIIESLERPRAAKALARRIWLSFVEEGSDTLSADDFKDVIGGKRQKEAQEAFDMLDHDISGDVSLEEMINKCQDIGEERKAISGGLRDIGDALKAFDRVLLIGVLVITIFIFLAFFRSSLLAVLATAGTTLLSLGFMFAVTAQEFLGSCIFLFVKHPYDVGDRVDIDGHRLVVEKISLMYSVFHRVEDGKVIQIPNILLNSLWIENVSRSNVMMEFVHIDVSFDTTFEDVELLQKEMEKFVKSPENHRDFRSDFTIDIGGIGNLDKLTLAVAIKHKSNWHNEAIRIRRRSRFMCALALAIKRVPIYGPGEGAEPLGGPTNPSYSVAVSDQFATQARQEADTKKDQSRLKHTSQKSASNMTKSESQMRTEATEQPATGGLKIDTSRGFGNNEAPRNTADSESICSHSSSATKTVQHGFRKPGDRIPSAIAADLGGQIVVPDEVAAQSSSETTPSSFDVEANMDTNSPSPLTEYAT